MNTLLDLRFQVQRAYKIAINRGAGLQEVKVFNFFYRFKNRKLNAMSTAAMSRPPNRAEEWIILLPDNVEATIHMEKELFNNLSADYYLKERIHSEELNRIEENLELLNPAERCAQSLMHEYGHVLHWRMFDALGIHHESDHYLWFLESGYADVVDRRIPNFFGSTLEEKMIFLKESLVEDYRIWLNISAENGMFILPNRFCYKTDLYDINFMKEGVDIMRKMLEPATTGKAKLRKVGFEPEINTLDISNRLDELHAANPDWVPGQRSMTRKDHEDVIKRLREKEYKQEVACTIQLT
jgi:hypothetical protein